MNWLTDLVKHLAISRSVTGALFVTAVMMHFGPRLFPTHVDAVPKEWAPVVVAAMIFSGCLLLFWGVAWLWKLLTRGAGAASKALTTSAPNSTELEFLAVLGTNPTTPFNLDNVDYSNAPFTKLELIDLIEGLERKGLVSLNQFDGSLISLTPAGRKHALEFHRQRRNGSSAA